MLPHEPPSPSPSARGDRPRCDTYYVYPYMMPMRFALSWRRIAIVGEGKKEKRNREVLGLIELIPL